jgi:hypothetical protein
VKTLLSAFLVAAVFMTATALEEGMASAYDAAVYGVYCADCILFGHVLGWVLLRIPVGRYCLGLAFGWLLVEHDPAN